MYKFIPVDCQSEGTGSTGYPPWLYGLEKIYLQRKRVQGEEKIKKAGPDPLSNDFSGSGPAFRLGEKLHMGVLGNSVDYEKPE